MSPVVLLGYAVLLIGIVYAVVLVKKYFRSAAPEAAASGGQSASASAVQERNPENAAFWKMALAEGIVYFLSAMGFPDFLQNIFLFQKSGWVRMERIPETLVAAGVVPGAVTAFFYLRNAGSLDMGTLVPLIAAVVAGSFLGSRLLVRLDASIFRRIMFLALIFSMAALIVKLIVAGGASGTGTFLDTSRLCIAVPVIFVLGFMNPFGVPMKPSATALFLLLGLSPVTTLTIMLALGASSPISAGIKIVKNGNYHQKMSLAALSFGSLGAVLGCLFAVSLDPYVLTAILLVIIAVTIVSMGRKNLKT